MYYIIILIGLPFDIRLDLNQRLYLSKAELNTKNSTRWQLCCHLVEFLDFNSIVNVEKKVTRDTRSFFAYFNRNKNKISTGD